MPSNPNSPQPEPAVPPTEPASTDNTEEVLKDVLEQLEKERMKRAEVESELKNITSSTTTTTTASNTNTNNTLDEKSAAAAPSSSSKTEEPPSVDIEEGVLKDVLEQLEKERIKRAEVESDLFNLKKKVEEYENMNKNKSSATHDVGTTTDATDATHNNSGSSNEGEGEGLLIPTRFDEADRMNKVQGLLKEFNPEYETKHSKAKKTTRRNVMTSLTALYTDIYDTVMKANDTTANKKGTSSSNNSSNSSSSSTKKSKDYAKDRDLHVKDEVSKFISQYQRRTPPPSFTWRYDEYIMKDLLNERLKEFIESLERLNSKEQCEEMNDQVEKMRMELISLRTEKDGLLELVNALSPNNQAFELASKSKNALPLEAVQLFEIIPWDDRAQSYANKVEFVHQWQIYDVKTKKWVDKHDLFADESASKMSNNRYHPSMELSSTEIDGKIVDLSKGYALPKKGTWEWIGTWQIEGVPHLSANSTENTDKGWVYSTNPVHIKSKRLEKCFKNAYEDEDDNDDGEEASKKKEDNKIKRKKNQIPTRKYRRRIWKRQRVLKSYPGISQSTHHMLKIGAQNAKLTLSVQKLNHQVFQMQNKLTETEENMDKATTELTTQLSKLELENKQNSTELSKRTEECDELKRKIGSNSSTEYDSPIQTSESKDSTTSISSLFKFSGQINAAKSDLSGRLRGESPAKSRSEVPAEYQTPVKYKNQNVKNEEKQKNENGAFDIKETPSSRSDLKISRTPLITSSEIELDVPAAEEENDSTEEKNKSKSKSSQDSRSYNRKYTEETVSFEDDVDGTTDFVKSEPIEEAPKEEKNKIITRNTGIDMNVISMGSLFNGFTSKVKGVENNIKAVAESARSLQKIASSLPVK